MDITQRMTSLMPNLWNFMMRSMGREEHDVMREGGGNNQGKDETQVPQSDCAMETTEKWLKSKGNDGFFK